MKNPFKKQKKASEVIQKTGDVIYDQIFKKLFIEQLVESVADPEFKDVKKEEILEAVNEGFKEALESNEALSSDVQMEQMINNPNVINDLDPNFEYSKTILKIIMDHTKEDYDGILKSIQKRIK